MFDDDDDDAAAAWNFVSRILIPMKMCCYEILNKFSDPILPIEKHSMKTSSDSFKKSRNFGNFFWSADAATTHFLNFIISYHISLQKFVIVILSCVYAPVCVCVSKWKLCRKMLNLSILTRSHFNSLKKRFKRIFLLLRNDETSPNIEIASHSTIFFCNFLEVFNWNATLVEIFYDKQKNKPKNDQFCKCDRIKYIQWKENYKWKCLVFGADEERKCF